MRSVLNDIQAERERQVNEEGWTSHHDDVHQNGELASAAACYANPKPRMRRHHTPTGLTKIPEQWPWHRSWWKPKDRRRDLIRAAALIVAEIERLDRLETTND